MGESSIATAADYADAMLIARSAKNALFLIILVLLLVQLAIFFVYRYEAISFAPTVIHHPAATAPGTTQPVEVARPARELVLIYLVGISDFLGVALAVVLALVLLLLVNIMLVGRLIGVARVTSAYIWTLIFLVLVFPWQAFLESYWFKIPGILYTWQELIDRGRWHDVDWNHGMQNWARFVVMPIVGVMILMAVQIKSVRGIRQALGETTDVQS